MLSSVVILYRILAYIFRAPVIKQHKLVINFLWYRIKNLKKYIHTVFITEQNNAIFIFLCLVSKIVRKNVLLKVTNLLRRDRRITQI